MPTIDLITMGCSKNLVDSEQLLYRLKAVGYIIHHNPARIHHDIAIVNTCGFINDAKQESIEMILQLCELKSEGRLRKVIVMGCLSERFREELSKEIPLVDHFYGKFDWKLLVDDLLKNKTKATLEPASSRRILTTPKHYSYIKISEGCNRHCAYCAIPLITGRHKSRRIEDILEEVSHLVSLGVKEFQIIAQELTYYGIDLYGERRIAQLIEQMAEIKGVRWIRLHYAYPNGFPKDLLRVMRMKKNVCNYLDIALQHSSARMLERMDRHITPQEQADLIREIRRQVPGISLRTTFMVGYPGETDEDFQQLLDFVKEARFERMGAFAYSEEEGTPAALKFKDDIPSDIKQQRLDSLMALQQQISEEIMATYVGKTLEVIIEDKEADYWIGRTEFDSPEVDGVVYIKASPTTRLRRGTFYKVRITDSNEFDLFGEIVDSK